MNKETLTEYQSLYPKEVYGRDELLDIIETMATYREVRLFELQTILGGK